MTKYDKIEKINDNLIQHGKYNDRVYLMKIADDQLRDLILKINKLQRDNNYSKIFVKSSSKHLPYFIKEEYKLEGYIPKLFSGKDDGVFLSKYFSQERTKVQKDQLELLYDVIEKKENSDIDPGLDKKFKIRKMNFDDIEKMADIYEKIFKTYPFPIFDCKYLEETMNTNVDYYGVWNSDRLIALSSSEIDYENKNAEMTDFAVLPEFRGHKLAFHLLKQMEKGMKVDGIKTVYTIARLKSIGMNLTFYYLNYKYSGTLINNTNISGGLESMNIWYKNLSC